MDASRSPPEPAPIVVALQGRVAQRDVRWLCERVRFLLEANGIARVVCDVSAVEDPDVGTVDALARVQLSARRLGGTVQLRGAGAELRDLIELAGLTEVLAL